MEPKKPSQTKRGMQIPSLFTLTKRAIQINPTPIPVIDSPPNPGPLEILENPSEKHVVPLALNVVNTPWPITNVQTIIAELPSQ